MLPDVAVPAAGRVVERNDLELLFHEQAEQQEGREPGGDGQRPPALVPAPFQLNPSPKIRRMGSDPRQELRRPLGRRLAPRSSFRRPFHELPQHGAVRFHGLGQRPPLLLQVVQLARRILLGALDEPADQVTQLLQLGAVVRRPVAVHGLLPGVFSSFRRRSAAAPPAAASLSGLSRGRRAIGIRTGLRAAAGRSVSYRTRRVHAVPGLVIFQPQGC